MWLLFRDILVVLIVEVVVVGGVLVSWLMVMRSADYYV